MKITIEEMLVERDIISRQQLERVKEIQKSHEDKSLTDMLLLLGYTTEDVIMNCFSDRDDMEIIHLEERTADPAAIEMLPESFIVNNEIVPVCFEKGCCHCHFLYLMHFPRNRISPHFLSREPEHAYTQENGTDQLYLSPS